MKKTIKKTAIILVGLLAISMASGSVLPAQEREVGSLITDTDLAIIAEASEGIVTNTVSGEASFNGLITAFDLAFISEPFSESDGTRKPIENNENPGIITAADYKFLTGGQEAEFLSAFDDFADSLADRVTR